MNKNRIQGMIPTKNNKRPTKIFSLVILTAVVITGYGCNSTNSNGNDGVLGTWEPEGSEGQVNTYFSITESTWTEVYFDSFDECYEFDELPIESMTSNSITVSFGGEQMTLEYEFDGNVLVLNFGEEVARMVSSSTNIDSLEPVCE